jgi:high-affinity nickel-transport protein
MASAPSPDTGGGLALTLREKLLMTGLYAAILGTTIAAFLASFAYLPHQFRGQISGGALIFTGLAITAYVLGVRHGFDADHIAAIDNTTRKLLNEGQRPLTVGTWFSLGHSTIVAGMIAALVVATDLVKAHYGAFASTGAVLGTLVSGAFLIVIGLVNLIIVAEVYRIFRGLRTGALDQRGLDEQLEKRGFLYRYFGRLFRLIRRPRQIYVVGVLFGLGFDTATEVLLISLSVGFAYASSVPLWAVMLLPLLFTCGMVLSDTTDGLAMRYAYSWAFNQPVRKIYYNLTLTVISVLVAFLIGGIEMLQVLSSELGLRGGVWSWLDGLDFETVGLAIVALFVGAWGVAMLIYRIKGFEKLSVSGSGRPPPAGA